MSVIPSPLLFTKMHGLGNDFMVLDATREPILLTAGQIRQLADRHFGVGFDQLLLVEAAKQSGVDFNYRIFNADGSEVEQCGNGARCFALYVQGQGLTMKNPIRVATQAGIIELTINNAGLVRVDMGVPKTRPADIPFIADGNSNFYQLDVAGEMLKLAVVNMGNPHAVLPVHCVEQAQVQRLGRLIETHPRFPAMVNVGFMQVLARDVIKLRVHERGTGETLACGSGACAAVVAGIRAGWLDAKVQVLLTGGSLQIEWGGDTAPVLMQGSASKLYEGQWVASL
ncbi:diaminopimelate epimerase [Denitrificimonas caeni]|uniref:diaminopimelate epimerase n=1 Tax=Denitrificimonas caeni TaxID=521720 RepID=UPI0019624C84|nr:diaminopimelate epimerase [Denitrificimonas caeni]